MQPSTLEKIKLIIATQTGLEPEDVDLEQYLEDDLNLDEVEFADILQQIEEEFEIEINHEEARDLDTVEDLVNLIEESFS